MVTDAIIDEYWERGYWISPKLFDDDQIARLRPRTSGCGQAEHDQRCRPRMALCRRPGTPHVRHAIQRLLAQ